MSRFLIIDDDIIWCESLAAALSRKGHEAATAHDHDGALFAAQEALPERIVLDLKIPGTSGLRLIPELLAIAPQAHIVVLTGYANVTTAVEAIKLGARHYLAKPVELSDILAAFTRSEGDASTPIETDNHAATTRLDVVEWQHIQTVLERNEGNISAAARELNMHRRTLQRKLYKRPPQG